MRCSQLWSDASSYIWAAESHILFFRLKLFPCTVHAVKRKTKIIKAFHSSQQKDKLNKNNTWASYNA